jgi:hypothetical protein
LETLDPDNLEAWRLFGQILSRLCVDVPGLVSPILARVVAERDGEAATDLLQRLSLIYETVCPPKTPH